MITPRVTRFPSPASEVAIMEVTVKKWWFAPIVEVFCRVTESREINTYPRMWTPAIWVNTTTGETCSDSLSGKLSRMLFDAENLLAARRAISGAQK